MDNAEALRALEIAKKQAAGFGALHICDAIDKGIAALTDPGYVRVPEAAIRKNAPCELDINEQLAWALGWNACRESMLTAATKETSHE
jgi:hypothetical protein